MRSSLEKEGSDDDSSRIGSELLERLRRLDPQAVAEFVGRYKAQVCRQTKITLRHSGVFARPRGNEDEFQTQIESHFNSALSRILLKIRDGQLNCDLQPVVYMNKIIKNRCVDKRGRDRLRNHQSAGELDTLIASQTMPDDVAAECELIEKYSGMLDQLTDWEQYLVQLRIFENMPYSQISQILSVPVHTLRARFSDVLRKLRILGKDT